MTDKKVPIEQIVKLADDIRLIKDFAENHNFDSSFINAAVVPNLNKKSIDKPLVAMVVSMLLVLGVTAVILFWNPPLSKAMNSFVFLIGLLCTISATMSAHLKFKENVITLAVVVGLIVLLCVGAGVVTPQEALDRAEKLTGKMQNLNTTTNIQVFA